MGKFLRVAEVSVDAENPPRREDLVNAAKRTKRYESDPEAEKNINLEIDKSGLYPAPKKADSPKSERNESPGVDRSADLSASSGDSKA